MRKGHHQRCSGVLIILRNPAEYMPMTETYSPVLHRLDQAVRWRAVHPNEPIPPPYEILTRYSKPPDDLVKQSKRRLEKLIGAADVKKGKKEHFAYIAPLLTLNSSTKGSEPQAKQERGQTPIWPGCRCFARWQKEES